MDATISNGFDALFEMLQIADKHMELGRLRDEQIVRLKKIHDALHAAARIEAEYFPVKVMFSDMVLRKRGAEAASSSELATLTDREREENGVFLEAMSNEAKDKYYE